MDVKRFIRGNIGEWKADSMRACGYRCVLTGDGDFHIHHVYGLAMIFDEIVEENNIVLKENFVDYTKEELEYILQKFIKKQSEYPLGVCVRKDIHRLFHKMYGHHATPEMWDRFVQKYKKGEISIQETTA